MHDETTSVLNEGGGSGDRPEAAGGARLRRGTTVGRYIVIDRLGGGGMGDVYSAWDEELRRRVALKLIRPRVGTDLREQVLAEARALARLRHPHVVAVHDVGEDADAVFVSMALLEGDDLATWNEQAKPSANERMAVLLQCAEGLAAAHDAGLVHHDVKPSNVVVEQREAGPWASLIDFGLAADADAGAPRGGTPAYMAPECRARAEGTAKADQWSLALLGVELLSGRRPERAAVAEGRIEGCGAPTAALRRALASDPSQRFEDVHALVRALRRAGPRRRAAWVGLAAASLLAAGTWVGAARQAPDCGALAEKAMGELVEDRDARVERLASQAPAVADSVDTLLQRWDARWIEAHTTACGEPEPQARTRCLEGQAREVSALLDVAGEGSSATSWSVLAALTRAVEPGRCSSEGGRAALTETLAQAYALEVAARFDEAATLAEEELARARAEEDDEVTLAALYRLASVEVRREDPTAALALGDEAMVLAARLGDPELQSRLIFDRAEAAILLGEYARADEAVDLGRAFVASAGDDPALLSYWHYERGRSFEIAERYDDAVGAYERSLEIRRSTAPGSLYEADALRSLGYAESRLARCGPASEHLRASIAIYRDLLGPDSPSEAHCLTPLASCQVRLGETEAGLASLERAATIVESAKGPASLALAKVLTVHGAMLTRLGDYAAALPLAQRAYDIRVRASGIEHPEALVAATNLGWMLIAAGDLDGADALVQRAWRAALTVRDEADPSNAGLLQVLSAVHSERGDLEEALRFQARAVTAAEAAPSAAANPESLVPTLANLGLLQLQAGRAEARATLERVHGILAASETGRRGQYWPPVNGALAKLALKAGESDAARSYYAQARAANPDFEDPELAALNTDPK